MQRSRAYGHFIQSQQLPIHVAAACIYYWVTVYRSRTFLQTNCSYTCQTATHITVRLLRKLANLFFYNKDVELILHRGAVICT